MGETIAARAGAGRRPVADAVRSEPARERAAQPRDQRARRDARRRHAHDRDRQRASRRRYAAASDDVRARPVRLHLRHRHRHRHDARCSGARLRSLLHHQADRPGHRARPVDGLRLRAPVGRARADRQRARQGHARSGSICRAIRRSGRAEPTPEQACRAHLARAAGRRCWSSRTRPLVRAAHRRCARRTRLQGPGSGRRSVRPAHPAVAAAHRSPDHRYRPARPQRPAGRRCGAGSGPT